MALIVESLYNNNSIGTNSTAKKGGLNVQSLRDCEFELKVNENKSIGNISYGAKQAIESNTLDSYTPKNDAEKSVLDTYKKWTGYGRTYETVKAQYEKNKFGKGNIDLTNRPIFKNSNGAISTVDSIGISEDGKEIVIPTIVKDKNGNAKRLTENEAIKHYHETGEYLGKFNTRDEADEYAQTLHIDQDLYYSALPEMTAEEEQTLSKYGFNPTSFSNDDFKAWAEAHNFEYRMAGNDLTGTEYKWLPKAASKWNPWKTLATDEEEQDKKVLERFIEKKDLKANATNHPVFTSAVTVVTAPYRGLAGAVATVKDGVSAIVGKNVNTYDTAHEIVDDANIIRETVTDEHASKWFDGASGKLGNYGALTYNGIMSIGDMVMTSLTTKGIGSGLGLTGKSLATFTSNATSALLGSNSASSTIMEKKKEGYSDGKAVLVGVATGLAEYITEKYSLESIFKAPASVMKQGIRSFIAEGSEEMASDVLSKIADRVIAGNDSTIKKSIENYMQNGMSKNDAIKQATQDSIYETLSAGLVGGLSGVAVSSAYHGFGRSEIKKTGADMRGVAADVIESGLDGPKNSNAYKYAEKLSKKGVDKITDYELGLQHIYNIEQIEYEQKKEEKATRKAEKAARKVQSSVSETADNTEQAPTNFPYNVYAEPQISVGDTFKDTKTGNTITVVERDAKNTVMKVDTGVKTETRKAVNSVADSFVASGQLEKVENDMPETPVSDYAVKAVIDNMTDEEKESHIGRLEMQLANGETNFSDEDFAVYKALVAEKNEQNMPVSTENAAANNQNAADSVTTGAETTQNLGDTTTNDNIIDHTKEVDGLKLIDTEESTLVNGKTLLTGVYELNSDKDFSRKSYKKEDFDYFRKIGNPWVKTVSGTTYGHYGFAKIGKDGYIVTYLPVGLNVTKANTENEAKLLLKTLEDNLPELPLSIKAFGDEYRCYGLNQKLATDIKNVIDSASESASEISLPLKNKKELISYLKNHKGSKIGVSYNRGAEDIRTIISASDTAIVTERADGQQGRLSAKANELSYTDDGFVYTGSNGVTVSYRFISEDVSSEDITTDNSVTETPESVTKTPESVENTSDTAPDETIEIETKMFNDIVDEVENDDTVSGKKGKHYYVSKHTPEIIVKKADIEDLPMIISFETLYLAVRENGELKGHYHGLGASNTKKLYKVLSDPTYILKNNENGRINIISDIALGKNNKSVISIELDVYKNVEGVKDTKHKGNYNLVITLFSAKDNYAENLKNKQEMSMLYEKKEDTHSSDLTSENMMLGNTENVSSDNIIAEETQNVNTSEEITTPALTDKCELHETTHTKTGKALWVISLNDKITSDEYKALSAAVKKVGGYYSNFAKTPDGKAIPGFIFKSKPDADVINTFNGFFGMEAAEETAPAETKSSVKEIDTEAKKVLQAYIDNGYGNEIASKHFKDVQRSAASSLTHPVGNDIMKVNQTKGVEKDGQSREGSQETGIKQTDILGLRGHDGRGYDRAGSERLRLYLGRGNRKDNSGSVEGFGGNRQEDRRYFGESVGERNQLIVNGGKSLANYVQIPETLYTDEMRSIAENNNRYGVDTIFTVGDISFRNFDDTTRKVPATVVDGKMFIDANLDAVLSDVSNHEMVHYAIRKLAAETSQDALNIARNLMTSVRSYMKPESFREVFGISTQLVRANYQKITKFNLLDEFCAEMGYLVRYHETSDWFSDYEGAVRLFDNLLTLEPQKQAWLQEVIKKDDASFKSKSEATNDSSPLGETSPANSIAQDSDSANNSARTNTKNATDLTDNCELIATKHTATGDDIWVITLKDRLSSEEYKELSGKVKAVGGYYSKFAKTPDGKAIPGFIFKSKPDADVINTFNGFFGMEAAEETAPAETQSTNVNEKVYELVKKARNDEPIDTKGLEEIRDTYGYDLYKEALDRVNAENQADELIDKAKELKSLMSEDNSSDAVLNNQPESDTMVSEKTKEDFKVGDILEFDGEQWKCVNIDSTMIDFENVDKNAFQPELSVILPYELFKEKTDYTVIKESAENVHDGILGRKSRNDDAVRESEPVSEVKEKRNIRTEDRELGEDVASENGKHIQSSETATSAAGQLDSRDNNNRVRESDSSDGNSGTGIDGNDNVDVAESSSKSKDYVITKTVAEDIDKSAPSMTDNIKAIETLHAVEKSGKAPTKTQQGLLAKFKGWGGLAGSFYGSNRTKLEELMSESEIKAAQSTVNDAYFTPTGIIDGIYKALSHLGFEGGNILEPSMGIGNFFGRMPKALKDKSSLFGVEIDSISGRIAQQLYPSASIEIAPFQDVAYKDGAFDLMIGNVPFGDVKYSYKGKKYLIHDYFFVKAMDKLNDGGILMFLTTKGTLDKLDSTTRTELSNRGKLLGAYRLPSDVFTKSAGASVVTDLIIMQKTSDTNGESFINLGTVAAGIGEFSVNEYFVNHPENVIGKFTSRKDWRSGKEVLDVAATGNVAEQLVKAIRKLPKNLLSGMQTVGSVDVTENNAPVQTFSVTENDTVEYIDAVTGEVKQIKGKYAKTAQDYVALKDAYQELVDVTLSDYETDYIESKRKALNAAYDGFVKKHGALEDNKKLLSADNDFYKMSGLEVYDTKTKKIVKSEMFTKDTLGKRKPKKADSVLDALSISIGETGGVDVNRIADLTGVSENEAIKQLDDRIVYTPDGIYELNEVYLSGNVREKYDAVKGKKGFEKNEKMLEAVIPADIPAKDITPQFGSPWIKPDYVADFLKETLHLYNKPVVSYDQTSGTWSISGNTWGDNTLLTNKYGTKYMDAVKIAEKALNMRRIVVTDKDTKKMLVGETRAAQQKAEDIKAAFEEWCFKDADRRKDLVVTFNRKFNSNRNMDFSELAKYLTFDGLTDTFKLRDYQKRAVARAVFNGNTLLAHGVGTGKTAEMIAISMELKRMGIAKKNMMVVPNQKVADFRNDILKMYPSARVAYLEKGANPEQRQRFYALVSSNDFDIVIIPHSAFEMLDVSADTKKAFINNQISELEEVLTAAQAEKGKIDGRFIRNLENQKKRLEERLKFITESAKDNGNVFEELGVDSLFVDEAHNFKNLPFYSKLSRVAGVSITQPNNKTRMSRAENMFLITDYLNRSGGRITFGTATPITNSMSEIYNMTRFLRPDILADAGLQSFDAWASMFGSIVNQAEVDPTGRNMRMKERFSKFKNVSQMIEQFRRMADILKTGDVIQDLPEAERIDVYNESNEIQEEFLDILDEIVDDIRINGQKSEHNMLSVTKAGQMAAIDLRFVISFFDGKYTLDDLNLPNNRTSQVAQKVYKEYVDSNKTKGTQFVFCDYGVYDKPGAKYGFYVYGDLINKLVALGIPRNEIAIAQEFEDKADLSARVNTGEIRVLIGSTAVMGEGMNAQNKAVALHHMTVPDRPSDIEQREGRIIRFGNENKNVRIYRYIQEKSYDSYQWQMQERKAGFINQALSGGTVSELEEMSDFQLSAREAKAIASGNPLLLEKIEIEDRLNNLKSIRNKFNTDKLEMQDRLAVLPNRIAKKEKVIADTTADAKTVTDNTPKDFEITLGKTKYAERAKAAEALKRGLANAPRNGTHIKIGSYRGLDLYYTSSFDKGTHFILKGSGEYSTLGGDSASGNITRITNLAEKIGETLEVDKALVANYKAEIETLKKEVDAEFPRAKELEELQAKLNDIDTQLGINVSTVDMSDVIVDDEAGSDDAESSKDLDTTDDTSRWTAERVEGSKDKGVTLSDIIKKISKEFDIPISSGKVTDREASGIYKNQAEAIRTRISNNLPTISHELGHHLNKRYELSLLESVEEIKDIVSDEFLNKYPADKINGELVAEFVRHYLKNKNEANRLCPEFYNDFIRSLSKSDLTALNYIANLVNEYMSYNISERYDAAITTSKEYAKSNRSVKDTAELIKQKWVDPYLYIKNAVDYVEEIKGGSVSGKNNAYKLATNALNSHSVTNFLLTGGMRDLSGNIVAGEKSFIECIADVNSDDMKLLDKYLVLRHSLEWIAPEQEDVTIKRVFADDTLEDVEEIKKQIAGIEDTHPEIKTAAENLYEYQNNILKYFVIPAGGMTEDTLTTLNRMYPSYVPFYRAKGKDKLLQGKAKSTFVNQQSPIKRAKGSGEMIISPLESILTNTEKMVNFSLRNQVGATLANYADTVDGFGQFMEAVPPDMIPHPVNISKIKDTFTDALQQVVSTSKDYFAVSDLFEELFSDVVTEYTPVANAGKKIVTVMKDGAKSYYQIHDDGLYRSVAELAPKQLEGFELVDLIMNFMKLTITQNNPIFAGTNAIRDFGTAYKLSEIDNPVSFTKAYVEAAYEIITKSENYKQYKAMGGGHSSELSANIEDISKTLRKVAQKDMGKARRLAYSIFRHPIETVAALNDAVESVPRFLEFQRTLKSGGDLEEAIYNANDLTTNFRRQGAGATAKVFNKLFLFNNAAIQGLDKTARALTNKNTQRRNKTWLKFALVALIGGLIRHFWNKEVDEEGYENLSSYKKNNFYNYAIGDGMFISLPKERENAILDSLVERVLEKVSGNDEAFYDFGGYLSSQLLPPMIPDNFSSDSEHSSIENAFHSWIGSTAFGGLADIGFNQDFKGTPIEGRYDKYSPSNERYSENGTSKLAYELGQTKFARDNNLSPKKIDHLISSYTGILGQVNKALFPMNDSRRDTSIGLRNKFISDSNYSTDVLNRMYENQEKAEKAFNYSGSVSDAIEYEKNSVITSYISGMNKAVKALPEDEQRSGRAYLLKTLNSWNYENTTSQSNMLNSIDGSATVSKDVIFSELPSSSLEWTVDKQKYVYQMTPQEYHKYISDYLTVIENARRHYGGSTVESYEAAKEAAKDYMSDYKKNTLKKQYLRKAVAKAE